MDLDFKMPCFFNLEPRTGGIRMQWLYYWRSPDRKLLRDLFVVKLINRTW